MLHCPYCHGFEVRDRQIGVLGGSGDAVRYAQTVRQWTRDVVFFTPAGSLTPLQRSELMARTIGVVEGTVKQVLVEDDRLSGVELVDGRIVGCRVLFVPPRLLPNSGLLSKVGCEMDASGRVLRDGSGQTTVRGIWVAGNVANPRTQVITAAGEGSASAIAVNADLVEEDIRNAVHAVNVDI